MKKVLGLFFMLLPVLPVITQSADKVTELLDTEKVTNGQIAYLIGSYKGLFDDDGTSVEIRNKVDIIIDPDDATSNVDSATFKALSESGYFPKNSKSTDAATLGGVSKAFAKMARFRGGVFYRLSYGYEKYAFRELQAKGIIPLDADPTENLSGKEAMGILYGVMTDYKKYERKERVKNPWKKENKTEDSDSAKTE